MLRFLAIYMCFAFLASTAGAATAVVRPHAPRVHHLANCPAYAGGTGILTDGDFSQATDPGNQLPTFTHGEAFAPDWVVAHRNINLYGSTAWGPSSGFCSVDLDGQKVGTIAHAGIPTQSGSQYTVTFMMSGNGACGPTVKQMTLIAGSQSVQFTWNISSGNDAQNNAWAPESWTFTAHGSVSTLEFQSKDPKRNACGAVVAAIAVNPVEQTRRIRS